MASNRRPYEAPSITSYTESEIMERMGSTTSYAAPTLDTAPGADPTGSSGGSNSKGGRGRGIAGKD
ncbi:MAG TPA: hypothetical protein VFW45_04235 [Candidatus Polarisedimenticolia bacterium]|nr:hypothetical protein [Candidatus Polarisedimenticolia bacterium]